MQLLFLEKKNVEKTLGADRILLKIIQIKIWFLKIILNLSWLGLAWIRI